MELFGVIPFLRMLWDVTLNWWIGAVRAMLPAGMLSKKSVNGQIILITGSGSGIGRLMAIQFGKLGGRIVLWDIDEKMNKGTHAILADLGIESHAYTIDLSDKEAIYATAERVKREVGYPDVLINNAGIVSGKKLFQCPDELMQKTMAVNCVAMFFTTKAFLPAMIERRQGHIVTIASLAGLAGVNGLVDYCASKFGAVGFSEALRLELIEQDLPITVTTVCTYYINTGMFDGVITYSPRIFPILDPHYVVDRIVHAVLTNTDELLLPWAAKIIVALKGIMPSRAAYVLGDYFGFNRTMETYKGRQRG